MKKTKLTDVAKAAGVSVGTVSRVINNSGYASIESQKAVWEAVRITGYEVSKRAASLTDRKLIGAIIKRLPQNLFFESINYALLAEAEKNNMYMITTFCEHLDNASIKEHAEKMLACRVCGIIICGFEEQDLLPETRAMLLNSGVPVVFVERVVEGQGINQININNTLGSYMATKHLMAGGHKKIVFIGREHLDAGIQRLDGFLRAIREAEQPLEYIVKLRSAPDASEGYLAMQEAFEEFPGFTAVLLWFDGYAIGALQYLYEHKIRVPDQIEVIGHDDTYSSLLSPPISSVQLPFEEMAYEAIKIILEWQDKTKKHFVKTINLEPKLILRNGK